MFLPPPPQLKFCSFFNEGQKYIGRMLIAATLKVKSNEML
uniref:Uncharacterized protein n=1 Tax=Anguilla anguilla TaxID=7936 RepID=A0A0E9R804_ANGAN